MGSSVSTPASSRPTLKEFECAVCAEEKYGTPRLIDSAPVCQECILEIVPKFHAALRYEAEYPVQWSASITLHPKDFAEHFEVFPAFMEQWTEKEEEYKTPGKDRLYCQGCVSFLGVRRTVGLRSAYCKACNRLVCGECGSKELPWSHECRKAGQDDLKDLAGYQECPNDGCNTPLCLEDGCNDVICRVCKTRFCWICKAVSPPHEHWNVGKPCPRYNQPGSENALFNDDVEEEDGVDEQDGELDFATTVGIEAAILLQPLPPAEPTTPGIVPVLQRLIHEESRRATLEDTPQGVFML